jgi:hypothetical protein
MDLLGMELACLAPLDHFYCIPEHRRLVEATTIHLLDESRGQGMMPTLIGVDVLEKLLALVR